MADSDFLREVDEDLRREQLKKLWDKFGAYIIAVVVAVVFGVGGFEAWQSYSLSKKLGASQAYDAALKSFYDEAKQDDVSVSLEKLSKEKGTVYSYFSEFKRAELALQQDKSDEAIAIWEGLSQEGGLKQEFRDLAVILLVQHQVGDVDTDSLISRVSPLASSSSAFMPLAKELLAVLFLQKGDKEAAQALLLEIQDDAQFPQSMRVRAERLLSHIQ